MVRSMHQLIYKIWLKDSMPSDFNLSALCLKKGDFTICAKYRGISLLPITYKVLTSVLCERLKPHAKTLIGAYKCGSDLASPYDSTHIDQIFTLCQILEKTHENQDKTDNIFVDFKAAFDSPVRDRIYNAMSELCFPSKLIRLCRMMLSNSCSSVKIGKELSEYFDTVRGFNNATPYRTTS